MIDDDLFSRENDRLLRVRSEYGSVPPPAYRVHAFSRSTRLQSLLFICIFNVLFLWDRYATAGVLPEVVAFYSISNTTAGFIQTAFIVVYTVTLFVTGYLGDHHNRVKILLTAGWLWFLLVAASSFIPREYFWLFMTLRSLAAVGDATVKVVGPALIADYFADKARGYALMIFFMSIAFGISLGVVGGSLFTGERAEYWQWSLRVAPLIGLPTLQLSHCIMKEPARGAMDDVLFVKETSHWEDIIDVLSVRTFWFILIALSLLNFFLRANAWWGPTLLLDAMEYKNYDPEIYHGIGFAGLQMIVNAVAIFSGIIGNSGCVLLSEKWRDSSCCLPSLSVSAPALVVALGGVIGIPFMVIFYETITYDLWIALAAAFVAPTVMGGTLPLTMEMLLNVISPSHRAIATAILNIAMSVTGDGPAPLVIGQLVDIFRGDSPLIEDHFHALIKAMLIAISFSSIGVLFVLLSAWTYPADIKRRQAAVVAEEAAKEEGRLRLASVHVF